MAAALCIRGAHHRAMTSDLERPKSLQERLSKPPHSSAMLEPRFEDIMLELGRLSLVHRVSPRNSNVDTFSTLANPPQSMMHDTDVQAERCPPTPKLRLEFEAIEPQCMRENCRCHWHAVQKKPRNTARKHHPYPSAGNSGAKKTCGPKKAYKGSGRHSRLTGREGRGAKREHERADDVSIKVEPED